MIFANLAKEFMEQEVTPEVDAIRFAKMATDGTTVVDADLADGDAFLAAIDVAVLAFDEAKVPQTSRLLYISAVGFSKLKAASAVTRNVDAQTSDGTVNRAIWSLDGLPVKPVVLVDSLQLVKRLTFSLFTSLLLAQLLAMQKFASSLLM